MPYYLYATAAALSVVCGIVFGVRRRAFSDGLLATLVCATVTSGFLSLRYAETAVFWLIGSPAAGSELLGVIGLIALPWILFHHDKRAAIITAGCIAAAVTCLWFQPSHFPFPVVYVSVVLSSVTRIALELGGRPFQRNARSR